VPTPDDQPSTYAATEVDKALNVYAGLFNTPNPAARLRWYHTELTKYQDILPWARTQDIGRPRLPLTLSIPAWRAAEKTGSGPLGVIVGGRRFIAHNGMDLTHQVMTNKHTGEQRVRFNVTFGNFTHYHAVAPVRSTIKETLRGPILRLTTEVVECRPPRAVVIEAIELLMGAISDTLTPEDFQP